MIQNYNNKRLRSEKLVRHHLLKGELQNSADELISFYYKNQARLLIVILPIGKITPKKSHFYGGISTVEMA